MFRAEAATILERARALLPAESQRDGSDISDEIVAADKTSVASVASVAAPVDHRDPVDAALTAVLRDYVAGAGGSALRTGFASWAAAVGFTVEHRVGLDVALNESGRVVAAMETRGHIGRPVRRQEHSRGRGVRRAHTHGFARAEGTGTCVQDYCARDAAAESGCGQTGDDEAKP